MIIAQSTNVSSPCSVHNFKTIGKLKNEFARFEFEMSSTFYTATVLWAGVQQSFIYIACQRLLYVVRSNKRHVQ